MRYRRFGRLGWEVSEIGYGMWGMASWSGSDDATALRSLERAIELGCNFFDTAWAYGDGHSEALLGQVVRAHPERRLYTATKIPPKNGIWPSRREFALDEVFPPDHIERSVRNSLESAGIERFDLVQFHVWEDGWLEDDRWLQSMEDLRAQGLIGGIGISINRWEPWNGVQAVRSGRIDAVQVIYNIFDQNPEEALLPACREMDVAVIARVPFDEGSLAGALSRASRWPDGDWRNTYFASENLGATIDRIERLEPLVPAGMTLAEMALGFILAQLDVSTTIPGMRRVGHVEQNLAVSDAAELGEALLERLRTHRWDRVPAPWSD